MNKNLIIGLVLLSFLFVPPLNAYAQTDFSNSTVVNGSATSVSSSATTTSATSFDPIVNTIITSLPNVIVNEDHNLTINPDDSKTWTGHMPYIQNESGDFVPYILSEIDEYNLVQVDVNGGQFIFDKNGSSVSVIKDGEQLIDNDRYTVRTAQLNSDEWSNLDVNNEPSTLTIDESGDYLTISFIKENNEGLFKTEYIIYGGHLKTTAYFTNYIYDNNKFAFTQTLHLPDSIISVNDQEIDLNNYVGQSFPREVLEQNEDLILQIKELYYNSGLGFENLWSVNISDANKISLDYANVEQTQTGINETMELDPTFGWATNQQSGYMRSQPPTPSYTGVDCSPSGITANGYINLYTPTSANTSTPTYSINMCYRSGMDYDISSIPDNAIISDVDLSVDVTTIGSGGRQVEFVQMTNSMEYYRLGTGNGNVIDYLGAYNDAGGNAYVSNTGIGTSVSNNNLIDLGSVADADLQSDLTNGSGRSGADVFTVGVKLQNEDRNNHEYVQFNTWAIFDAIQLQVTYTSSPDAPTPTATQNTTTNYNTVDLTWNTPSANGAPITSYDVYRGGSNIGTVNSGSGIIAGNTNQGATGNILSHSTISYAQPAVDSQGNVYAPDEAGSSILKWNSSGVSQTPITNSAFSSAIGGVYVDQHDNLFIADRFAHDVKKYDSSGNYLGVIISGLNHATSVAVDSNDDIYVTSSYSQLVKKYDSSGTHLYDLSAWGGGTYLHGLSIDSQDNVYVTGYYSKSYYKFDSSGNHLFTKTGFTTGDIIHSAVSKITDHIVVGVYGGDLYEFDSSGNALTNWNPTGAQAGSQVFSPDGMSLWVKTDSTKLYEYDYGVLGTIPPATTFIDTSAPDSSNLSYTVDATNSVGTSSQSSAGLVETFYSPNAPTNLTDQGVIIPLIIDWTASTVNSVTSSIALPDSLGSSVDGTNNGATTGVTGKIGNAWDFDGSNDYVNLTANTLLGNNWSFGMWLKGANSGQTPSLWHFAGKGSADNSEVFNIYDQGGGISYEVQSTSYGVIPTASLDDGQWHYVVITYDGSDMRAYVDNTLEDTHPTVAGTSSAQARDLVIGQRDRGYGNAWFAGLIDEMTIYDITLGTTEISSLYNSGNGTTTPPTSGLLAYYDFEQTGSTLTNISSISTTTPSPSVTGYKIERDDGSGYNTIATLTGTTTSNTYPIVVGTGGIGGSGILPTSVIGSNGGDSSFNGITANGGSGGGGHSGAVTGGYGIHGPINTGNGSGGGNLRNGNILTGGIYGNDGGLGVAIGDGAGGGGFGSAGSIGSNNASGGAGTTSSISGTSISYASGGDGNPASQGNGINGATIGSGGSGAKDGTGGSGADGIVIIRYLNTSGITATGGTITTSGNYNIHTFTSNGNFVVTNGSGNVEYLIVGGGSGGGNDGSDWLGYARASGGGGAGAFIESVGTVSTSLSPPPVTYTDNTASGAVTYKVSGLNAVGTGAGATHNAIGGTVPDAPSNLTTTQTAPFIHDLSWTVPGYNGGVPITNYNVYRDGSLLTTLGNVTSYQDNTMQHIAHTHMYEVSAVNSIGEGPKSNQSTITSWDIPAVVTGVVATAQVGSQIQLDWNIPNNGGTAITGYRIQSSIDNITFTDVVASTTIKPYIHTGLTNGVVYYYKISAINVVGEGATGSAQTIVGDIPDTPSSMTVVPQAGVQITITIAIPNDNGYSISAYGLQRSSDNFTTFTNLTAQSSNVFVDQNLVIGTSYQYKATATNSLGTTPFSVASVSTIAGDVPSTPTAPGAVVNTT